jgi:DMSO/TMAO reductase YedYZ molybdopterin-dependent catalytic subunit
VFLGLIGLGAAGVLFGSKVSDWLARQTAGNPVADIVPLGAHFRFYTVTGDFPSRPTEKYTLRVHGLVNTELLLTYDQLTAMPPTLLTKDFQCVTGWRVPDVKWVGVKLKDVLDLAGVQASANSLRFTSFDGVYTESLTLSQARRDDVLVAYRLDGDPISSEHGGPVRLYVAPMYGYKSCKWLDTIELTNMVHPGYWELEGYDVDGWVGHSNGRDDAPTS